MIRMIYLWTEDREEKSGYRFWKMIAGMLFGDRITVESKRNNSELVKAVEKIRPDGNQYLIAFDHAYDNTNIGQLADRLKEKIKSSSNICLLEMYSFEYILLSFQYLTDWVFEKNSILEKKRKREIDVRNALLNAMQEDRYAEYKEIIQIRSYFASIVNNVGSIDKYSIETFSAKLLHNITRNTGFFVDKNNLGDCWYKRCCTSRAEVNENGCGLFDREQILDKRDKCVSIYKYSDLKRIFSGADLEKYMEGIQYD